MFHISHGDFLIDVLGANQIIQVQPHDQTKEDENPHQLETSFVREAKLIDKVMFLLKYSAAFSNLSRIQLHYESATSYTFRVNLKGQEHIKIKLPKPAPPQSSSPNDHH